METEMKFDFLQLTELGRSVFNHPKDFFEGHTPFNGNTNYTNLEHQKFDKFVWNLRMLQMQSDNDKTIEGFYRQYLTCEEAINWILNVRSGGSINGLVKFVREMTSDFAHFDVYRCDCGRLTDKRHFSTCHRCDKNCCDYEECNVCKKDVCSACSMDTYFNGKVTGYKKCVKCD